MANYIETVLRYDKMSENGIVKKVREHYLVDALSFTEAEARIISEMEAFISGEFSVSAVKKTKIAEVFFHEDADRYYLAKVAFITIDERTAAEKKTISHILVMANDFDGAVENFKEGMKGTMADYELVSLAETAILDVFKAKFSEETKS